MLKLKNNYNSLHLLLCMIIDQFKMGPEKDKKGECKYTILPQKDKDLKFEKEKYSSIHIFTDDKYYDNTYTGEMIYNRSS